MPLVKIQYGTQHLSLDVDQGASLLDAIRLADLPFAAPCGGKGTCGKCKVYLENDNCSEFVLACQTQAEEGMSIKVNDASSALDVELLHPAADNSEFGIAIDLGSTTLAAELVDLKSHSIIARAGCMNPQSIFGADVISRIEAANTGHLDEMHSLIVNGLYRLISTLCKKAAVPLSSIVDIVLAGNTIMEHIAAGLSPVSIGIAPYTPLSHFGEPVTLWEDLPPVWFTPCISGYVGGDIVAGMLSGSTLPYLLIDLGTNGELALLTNEIMVSAATAAGPVFEGMNVRCGMPALPGAISDASYDDATDVISVEVLGNAEIRGICGSGLIDLIAIILSHELIDETGRLLWPDEIDSPLGTRIVTVDDAPAFKPLEYSDVVITQKDIRNLQLAKAAIAAGIEILLDEASVSLDDLASLGIAGGFGQHMDNTYAAMIGIIPAATLDRSASIGNSSLDGARKILLDQEVRQQVLTMARDTRYIELSVDNRFSGRFVENMGFE